jgi:hypothetical protein
MQSKSRSSGNVREAQRFRIARVTFPQRLLIGTPLCGDKDKEISELRIMKGCS